ncbi:mevalonate kinase [Nocardia colli]|nr:mevalonate kinase [Nocardia colli]
MSDDLYRTAREHRVGTGSAHGKIILLGEHTVVYGMPAIAIPMPDLRVDAVAYQRAPIGSPYIDPAPRRPDTELIRTVHIDPGGDDASGDSIGTAAHALLRILGYPAHPVDVVVRCAVPPGRGLGASAACALAAVRALADHLDHPLPPETLRRAAQRGEDLAHGTASGIDAAACLADGPIWFEAGWVRPLTCPARARIVVADTGIPGSTSVAVAHVRTRLGVESDWARKQLITAAALTRLAADDLATGALSALGRHCLASHALLSELGVSCQALDRLVTAAVDAGAPGAKLTGGGLGGCMIALAEDIPHADRVAAALERAGAVRIWTIPFGAAA